MEDASAVDVEEDNSCTGRDSETGDCESSD